MAVIHVPMSEAADQIRKLLAAAQELGLDPTTAVKTSSDGMFGFSLIVPDEVLDRSLGVAADKPNHPDSEPEPEEPPKRKGGRPRKAAAEPVVEVQE